MFLLDEFLFIFLIIFVIFIVFVHETSEFELI
jgi:hypothetical protein